MYSQKQELFMTSVAEPVQAWRLPKTNNVYDGAALSFFFIKLGMAAHKIIRLSEQMLKKNYFRFDILSTSAWNAC